MSVGIKFHETKPKIIDVIISMLCMLFRREKNVDSVEMRFTRKKTDTFQGRKFL